MTTFLLHGGRVLLPEPAPDGHDAVAVADGRIVQVGPVERCRAALRPGAPGVTVRP